MSRTEALILKYAAMKGSISSIEKLSVIAAQDCNLQYLLPVIMHHLNSMNMPAQNFLERPQAAVEKRVTLAAAALHALSCNINGHPEAQIYAFVKSSWPNIWEWVRYFVERWILGVQEAPSGAVSCPAARFRGMEISVLVMDWLYLRFNATQPFVDLMGSTPQFVEVMTRAWLVGMSDALRPQTLWHFSALLQPLLRGSGDRDAFSRAAFFRTAKDSGHDIVYLCTKAVVRDSRERPIPFPSLESTLEMIVITAGYSADMSRCFLARQCPSLIVRVMSHLASRPPLETDCVNLQSPFKNALGHCMTYLTRCFEESQRWIPEALQDRLLSVMFRAITHTGPVPPCSVNHAEKSNVWIDIIRIIQSYLIYPCVLREAVRSMKTIEALRLESRIEDEEFSALHETWMAFKEEVLVRRGDRVEYKRKNNRYLRTCAYSQCPRIPEYQDDQQKRCARCLVAVYCSAACQTKDWQDGHRQECEENLIRYFAGLPNPPTLLDMDFFTVAVERDFKRSHNAISELKAERMKQHGIETDLLVVEIDYQAIPRRISIHPVTAYEDDTVVVKRQDTISRARAGLGTLVLARIPTSVTLNYCISPVSSTYGSLHVSIQLFLLVEDTGSSSRLLT